MAASKVERTKRVRMRMRQFRIYFFSEIIYELYQ